MIKNLAELFGVTKLSAFCPDGRTCAFTGHRPQNLPFRFNESDKRCIALKKQLRKLIVQLIEQHNVTHFISGMAIGVDMYAAEIVLDLKAKYPHITLESAIPCETQATKWSEPLRDRYFKIAERCDKETMLQTQYTPDCMQKRNRYIGAHLHGLHHLSSNLVALLDVGGDANDLSLLTGAAAEQGVTPKQMRSAKRIHSTPTTVRLRKIFI